MRSVAWMPGWTELTVTPSEATSRAVVLRKPVSPERAVLERINWGMGSRTAAEVIATTLPHPRCCMSGTRALHMAMVDNMFSWRAAG